MCSGLNLHSANLPVNKKKVPKIPQIILDYSRIPGHTYYSQKDASIIYLSLVAGTRWIFLDVFNCRPEVGAVHIFVKKYGAVSVVNFSMQ